MKYLSILLLVVLCVSAMAQDVSHLSDGLSIGDKMILGQESYIYDTMPKSWHIHKPEVKTVFVGNIKSESALGMIEWDGLKYYITDKYRRIEISQQLAELLIKSYRECRPDTAIGTDMRPEINAVKKLVKHKPKINLPAEQEWTKMTGHSVQYIKYGGKRIDKFNDGEYYLFDFETRLAKRISKHEADSIINSKRIFSTEYKKYKRTDAIGIEDIPKTKH